MAIDIINDYLNLTNIDLIYDNENKTTGKIKKENKFIDKDLFLNDLIKFLKMIPFTKDEDFTLHLQKIAIKSYKCDSWESWLNMYWPNIKQIYLNNNSVWKEKELKQKIKQVYNEYNEYIPQTAIEIVISRYKETVIDYVNNYFKDIEEAA